MSILFSGRAVGATAAQPSIVQKLVRGDEEWPQGGMPDVLAAVQGQAFGTEGKRKMVSGDAYIGFVKFPKNGGLPLIETVNTFGASSIKGNKHFADQRPLYQAQQLKKMTLDKNEVLKKNRQEKN